MKETVPGSQKVTENHISCSLAEAHLVENENSKKVLLAMVVGLTFNGGIGCGYCYEVIHGGVCGIFVSFTLVSFVFYCFTVFQVRVLCGRVS